MPELTPPGPWRPDAPYDSLPELPPPGRLETPTILKRCIDARAALARLDTACSLIPNPELLLRALPVLEAKASSEIENIVTTADKLFEHLHAETDADPATKEALRYRTALLSGFGSLDGRPLCTATAEKICSEILGRPMRIRQVPGTTLVRQPGGEVIYTPPAGESRLRSLLANWERFVHADDELDPLVRMAIAHYQFEAIHPFTDGNGRTGRVLNSLLLVERGLLSLPILYLSRSLIRHRAEYYELLLRVTTHGEWSRWVEFIIEAVAETARWTLERIALLRELAERTADYVRSALPKIYSRELVDILLVEPYCRIGTITEAGLAKRQTASRHLSLLVEKGVLEPRRSGREKLFVNRRLLRLLTEETDRVDPFPEPREA